MSLPSLNLVIYQGDTFSRSFQLMHSLRLERTLNRGDTRIRTSPSTVEIPASAELVFVADSGAEAVVTTTAIVPVGANQIFIPQYSGAAIGAGAIAETLPQDLTGVQCRGQIRQTADSAEVLTEFSFEVTPLNGLIRTILSSSQTEALDSNCEYEDLPIEEADLADPAKFKNFAWGRAYQTDFELMKVGVIQTIARARIWVPREITR